MNAPSWLPPILAAVMLVIAGYNIWRLAVSRIYGTRTDYQLDIAQLLLSVATAGMLVKWMNLATPGFWALILAIAGLWLLLRATPQLQATSSQLGGTTRLSRASWVTAGGCAVAVYMLLAGVAPSTIQGSTAGEYTMAGMTDMYKDSTITYPTLGILLAVVLVVFAVAALDHVSRHDGPSGSSAQSAGSGDAIGWLLAPRTSVLCGVALAVTMAYAILAKLV